MRNQEFDFSGAADTPGGWRLDRMEMANWGTFGGDRVHVLSPATGWSLLVGENGSGKSTVVDALRTLLVPRRLVRYSFNNAAGGQKKQDRSLISYIRGAWSTARDEDSADTQTRHLRKEETPSYLLAVFRNARRGAVLTIAQILWVSNGKDEALFLIANGEKSIINDLQIPATGRELQKKLRERDWKICESSSYREEFCARMGIPGDGALEIFNQAIGVKEVSDVNAFLRRHLLAPGTAEEIIYDRVIPQFANLDDCWGKIETAEKQIKMLAPIVEAHAQADAAEKGRSALRELLNAVPWYYAKQHEVLLTAFIASCTLELDGITAHLQETVARTSEEQSRRDTLRQQLDNDETGRRLKELELSMKELELRVKERRTKHDQLVELLNAQSLGPMPNSEATFVAMRERVRIRQAELEVLRAEAKAAESRAGVEKLRAEDELKIVRRDLDSLRNRRALIPEDFQSIRDALCVATGVASEELPFAGELMEVKPEYAPEWAGSLERLLRSFGISLLVPERHYQRVAPWINGRRLTNMRGEGLRFTFHRLPAQSPPKGTRLDDPRAVVMRLNFREEHPFASWVEAEVRRSYPHVCCRDTAELEKVSFGITALGLIRSGSHHVKDDRQAVLDRRHFVLGWSPEQKLRALEEDLERLITRHVAATQSEGEGRRKVEECDTQFRAIGIVEQLKGFAEIDFHSEQEVLARFAREKAELEAADDHRRELQKQFDASAHELKELQGRRDKLVGRQMLAEQQSDAAQSKLSEVRRELAVIEQPNLPNLEQRFSELEDRSITHGNVVEVRDAVSRSISGKIGRFSEEVNSARQRMIKPMADFLNAYPEENKQLQAIPEYAEDFCLLHERLKKEDLPSHKERFRDFLNDNLTQSISILDTRLDEEFKTHQARLEQVNATLVSLDYSPGTFVELDRRPTRDAAIRTFRNQLRDCLSAGLQRDDEHARLTLYGKIRELVVRFSKEPDWTSHVADSRRWLDFGVRERRRLDGEQVNYFDSSVGKSGGQKAKLAFTMLAASLLAQYGLADDSNRPDSLRLVVVDEVFARTDEENSRRALELFKRMGFQLLVVVPWEAKARIAEGFVDSFHLTLNPNGDASVIQVATRAQYEGTRTQSNAQSW